MFVPPGRIHYEMSSNKPNVIQCDKYLSQGHFKLVLFIFLKNNNFDILKICNVNSISY